MIRLAKPHILLLAIILIATAGAALATATVLGNRETAAPSVPSPSPTTVASGPAAAGPERPSAPVPTPGVIQGKKIFPGEVIPPDFRVCATNLDSGREVCSSAGGPAYRLDVPPGRYQVYGVVPSFDPSYRAYYNRFVTCGLKQSCTDHTPVTVAVAVGQTVAGIDVGDFYK